MLQVNKRNLPFAVVPRPNVQHVPRRCHQNTAAALVGDLNDHIAALVLAFARMAETVQLKTPWVFTSFLGDGQRSVMEGLVAVAPVLETELCQ